MNNKLTLPEEFMEDHLPFHSAETEEENEQTDEEIETSTEGFNQNIEIPGNVTFINPEESSTESIDDLIRTVEDSGDGLQNNGNPHETVVPDNHIFAHMCSHDNTKVSHISMHLCSSALDPSDLLSLYRNLEITDSKLSFYWIGPMHLLSQVPIMSILRRAAKDGVRTVSNIVRIWNPSMLDIALSASEINIQNVSIVYMDHHDERMTAGKSFSDQKNFLAHAEEIISRSVKNLVRRRILTQEEADNYQQGSAIYIPGTLLKERLQNAITGVLTED